MRTFFEISVGLVLLVLLMHVLRSKAKRPLVWLVDDREENRARFRREHGGSFELEFFEDPAQVLQAIESGRSPDALLCDIYFFDDPERREEIESQVKTQVEQLKKTLPHLGMENASGIDLIANVRAHFGQSPRFPIYAYTSKGPYLLQNEGFDRLENLDARWLFKDKYSAQAVRHRINSDIQELRDRFDWPKRLWQIAITTGVVGAVIGVLLDRLARGLGF